MQGNIWLLLTICLPFVGAPVCYVLEQRKASRGIWAMVCIAALCLLQLGAATLTAHAGSNAFSLRDFCGLGMRLSMDGFRGMYAFISAFMWILTALFSLQYMQNDPHTSRYIFFTLLTFGAALGVMLSDSLFTLFIFFELLSLASYPWVAHQGNSNALSAAQTYLYVAIICGMTLLMGLFLLPQGMAEVAYAALPSLAALSNEKALFLPACLMLIGFGAKAGLFPLHIWLPKAHPVAPAPASALLSGLMTKAGVLGLLIIGAHLLPQSIAWGTLIFWLGLLTMLLGAVLALFSKHLKRTLACSSLSQIGFIVIGAGLCVLLKDHNALAAWGTVQHMVNHSLLKLLLFLIAGILALNSHSLLLEDIQGMGRGKHILHFAFLMGMFGISGVPFWNGYASKSLLHEALLEYNVLLQGTPLYTLYFIAEKLFLLAGGMTFAYMLKLYVCLFWHKSTMKPESKTAQKPYASRLTLTILVLCALLPPLLGILPSDSLSHVGMLAQSFLNTCAPAHTVHYFSTENLLGASISLVSGVFIYALFTFSDNIFMRKPFLPISPNLEEQVYRPLLRALITMGYAIACFFNLLVDGTIVTLKFVGLFASRLIENPIDALAVLSRKTLFRPLKGHSSIPIGNHFTYYIGSIFDAVVWLLNKTIRRKNPIQTSFVCAFAAGQEEMSLQSRRLAQSISFGLLLFCIGLFATLSYLLL